MTAEIVTIAVYDTPYLAGLAKSELESYDIPAFVADEYTIGLNNLYSNALRGVKVNVPARYAEEAHRILIGDRQQEEDERLQDLESSCSHTELAKSFAWFYLALGILSLIILLFSLFGD